MNTTKVFSSNFDFIQRTFHLKKLLEEQTKVLLCKRRKSKFYKHYTGFTIKNKPVYKVGKKVYIGNEQKYDFVLNTLKKVDIL